MRGDVDGLDYFANGALLDQAARVDGGLHLQQFAVHDAVDAVGFRNGLADGGELFEGGDAGFVGEEVLAQLHGADAERGAFAGDLRAEDELDGGIIENFVLGGDDFDAGIALGEHGQFVGLAAPGRHQFAAAALDGADHAVNMVMAHAADGEFDVILGLNDGFDGQFRALEGAGGFRAQGRGAGWQPGQQSRHGAHGSRLFQKIAPKKKRKAESGKAETGRKLQRSNFNMQRKFKLQPARLDWA